MAVDVDFDFPGFDRLIAVLDRLAEDSLDAYRSRSTGAEDAQDDFRGTYARTFSVATQEEAENAVSVARRCTDEAAAWRSQRALAEADRDDLMAAERSRFAELEQGQVIWAGRTDQRFR